MSQKSLDDIVRRHRVDDPIPVTRPTLPDRSEFERKLERLWETAWLTNDGEFQREFRAELSSRLGSEHLSLCASGTAGLLLALRAAGVDGGEVITTPFTFPATPHAVHWNGATPVFCDVEEKSFTLDPNAIEDHIGPDTRAILPVHVYGIPCDVDAIAAIAERHGLAVIYDSAHAMGVRCGGKALVAHGDFSVLSFHATKLFTTGEGGAVVSHTRADRDLVDSLKNFGIVDEESVVGPGINGKMSELHAAFGLLQLAGLETEIATRGERVGLYRERLRSVPGITFREDVPGVVHNHAYFPVLVDAAEYGMSRDELCDALRSCNVHPRKYFYPLCSHYSIYASLPSADPAKLPVAERVAERVLCLPLYGGLSERSVETVCAIIAELRGGD